MNQLRLVIVPLAIMFVASCGGTPTPLSTPTMRHPTGTPTPGIKFTRPPDTPIPTLLPATWTPTRTPRPTVPTPTEEPTETPMPTLTSTPVPTGSPCTPSGGWAILKITNYVPGPNQVEFRIDSEKFTLPLPPSGNSEPSPLCIPLKPSDSVYRWESKWNKPGEGDQKDAGEVSVNKASIVELVFCLPPRGGWHTHRTELCDGKTATPVPTPTDTPRPGEKRVP